MSQTETQTLPLSRRQFCAGACQAASGVTLATLLTACGGSSPTSPSGSGGGGTVTDLAVRQGQLSGNTVRVNTAGTPLDNVGGAVLVQSTAGVFLVSRSGATSFTALDAVCSHESNTISRSTETEFVCPGHGSRFTRTGQVTLGPARASLRQFNTTFADGVVTITL
jgi:Rieske Fe-S protein